jgi:hypothetical protein
VWKLQGKQKPSVFFGEDGRPVVKPIIANEWAVKSATESVLSRKKASCDLKQQGKSVYDLFPVQTSNLGTVRDDLMTA